MSNEMEKIKDVKVSDVFDLTSVTFPSSYTDKQVRVAGRAIASYDRLVEENAELRELVKSYKLAADEVTKYKHALSYNESYAGEPNGEMKNNLAELDMVSCKALKFSKQIRANGNA